MAGGKGKSHGGKSGLKVGADGSKKQQSHSSKAGLQVSNCANLQTSFNILIYLNPTKSRHPHKQLQNLLKAG
jgi:hypothetical protein